MKAIFWQKKYYYIEQPYDCVSLQVWQSLYLGGVSGGRVHFVSPVRRWSDDPMLYGGHRVREVVPAEKTLPDASVQSTRGNLPSRRQTLSAVPCGRYAKIAHYRHQHQCSDYQAEGSCSHVLDNVCHST